MAENYSRRDFFKLAGAASAYALVTRIANAQQNGAKLYLIDQNGAPISVDATGVIGDKNIQFNNGVYSFVPSFGDADGNGAVDVKDLEIIQNAATGAFPITDPRSKILSNVDGKEGIGILDYFTLENYVANKDSTGMMSSIPQGQNLAYVVRVNSGEGFVGVKDIGFLVVPADSTGKTFKDVGVGVWKLGDLSDKVLAGKYANNLDLYADLASASKWNSIGINYGNYSFAGINHSQIMKEEAVKLNNSLGFTLFKEGTDVSVDYTTDKSLSEVTLYDANGPVKGKIFKKKYCGAENWSRAEAQRLLISLALGKPIDDQFFPDERIAVEVKDQRIPTEFVDALKAMYKTGVSVSNMREYEQKPKIIVDKAEINSPIKLTVVPPDGSTGHGLEYLVAQNDTREFWSAESADAQPAYQGTDGGKGRIYTFETYWAGLRRFRATAQKDGKALQGIQDVLVKADKDAGYLKGISLLAFLEFMNANPLFYIYSTLNRLKNDGVNMITLVPHWFVEDYTSTNIHPENGFSNGYALTWSDELTTFVVNAAKEYGMKVMFKPHISIKNVINGNSWMGTLQPANGNWDALFESHKNYLLHYATLAHQLGVEYLSLGTELNSMTLPNWRGFGVTDPDPRWRKIISEVRKVYNGKLTLSPDSNQYGNQDNVNLITFWDALDFIGFEPYFGMSPLVGDPGISDPTLDYMQNGFEYWFDGFIRPVYDKLKKKILVTESGNYSFDGSYWNVGGLHAPRTDDVNFKQHADFFNVLLNLYRQNNIFEAVNWWSGFIYADSDLIKYHKGWDGFFIDRFPNTITDWIFGKPVEKVIQANWKR